MRTTRSYDPQSGITTVKDITLISTSGVTFNEYNELPEKNTGVDSIRAAQAIAESINSLAEVAVFNQEQNVESMYNIAQSIEGTSNTTENEDEKVIADTIMVKIGEDSVSLNDAIASILQSLSTLTTKVDSLINTTDSGSESSNITSTE